MDGATIIAIITIIGGVIAIIKGAFGLLQYTVRNIVNPLSINIAQLQQATQELRNFIDSLRNDMQSLDKRLTICEQSTKSAHKRLDRVCAYCDKTHADAAAALYRRGDDED